LPHGAVMESACQASVPSQPAPPDPLAELQRLRELNRRWRRGALAIGGAFFFLFFLSLVQFLGTLAASKFLKEAQRESSRMNRETADILRELRSTQQRLRLESKTAAATMPAAAAEDTAKNADQGGPANNSQTGTRLRGPLNAGQQQTVLALQKAQAEQSKALAELEQERIQQVRQAIKKLRDEGLPAGHEPDKNCPFPVK
jgi:hypothetical protein